MRQRLAGLRGPAVPPRPLDARALAALAANPGCGRRALLDGAGVDKTALASALGSPAAFGQSQFAIVRGNSFEAKVKGDGGAALLRLVHEHLGAGAEPPGPHARVPDLTTEENTVSDNNPARHLSDAGDAVRAFNHTSRAVARDWEVPSHAYSALGNLSYMAGMLEQAVQQSVRPVMH
ncbi:hypothetical protein ABT106_17415, partial [Streptomyces sp. NPDC002044]